MNSLAVLEQLLELEHGDVLGKRGQEALNRSAGARHAALGRSLARGIGRDLIVAIAGGRLEGVADIEISPGNRSAAP